MVAYERYPAVDENLNFSPEVRAAFALSLELTNAMLSVLPTVLPNVLSTNPGISAEMTARIAALTLGDLNLLHKGDTGVAIPADYSGSGYIWGILDPANLLALGIAADGTVTMSRLSTNSFTLANKVTISQIEENEYSWAVVDSLSHMSELRLGPDGRIPIEVLTAWASRMNWTSDDIAATLADLLGTYQPGLEVGSVERAVDYPVTLTAPGTKIPGMVLDITGAGRAVDLEFRAPNVFHTVANTPVNANIYVNGTIVQTGAQLSAKTTKGPPLMVKQRVVLTAGVHYTIDVDFYGDAAGTSTMDVSATSPAYLIGTNR